MSETSEPEARPYGYLLAKLDMVMPLFQEARDALPAITEERRRLRGISSTLADRMDAAGVYSSADWRSENPVSAPEQGEVELPELPKRIDTISRGPGDSRRWIDAYSADQMREYARSAVAQALKGRGADADRLDAARYRWLRSGKARTTGTPKRGRIEVFEWDDRSEGGLLKGKSLDAAVDAAMGIGS